MTGHLLLVALGPVQGFIAQARRTRDLWYGSHLLSELARSAARALLEGEAKLIFPALDHGSPELEPCLAPVRKNGDPPLSIANKLLAEIPDHIDPGRLAQDTRQAVLAFWRNEVATPVRDRCVRLLADGTEAVWREQIESLIEFAASWTPLSDYASARMQVEEAIAGRKRLRDFEPWLHQRGHVPKSSLDGARETVLRPPERRSAQLVRKYRIADGEQLDAVGLVKRAGGEPEQFVPIVNVAFSSWTQLASEIADRELDALQSACKRVGLSRVARDLPCARSFPFDGSILLPSRWTAVFMEQELEGDPEDWGQRFVSPLLRRLSQPVPYVACLAADGDRMGRTIDDLSSAEEHRAFSQSLAAFAGAARKIVEQDHPGSLVYAGGDDVVAFLPLPEALSCADALRRAFLKVRPAWDGPTLSVGLGIGHVMESMGDLLQLGREAEREAKRDRNSLAVVLDKRSGDRHVWRLPWDSDPVARLHADRVLLGGDLSSRKVYEVARILRVLPLPGDGDDEGWSRALRAEVARSLARVGEDSITPSQVGLELGEGDSYAACHGAVADWVQRMLVARLLAEAQPRAMHRTAEVAS